MSTFKSIEKPANSRRIGVIDMGTNTFSLLIADVFDNKFEIVYTEKIGVAIGMGGINKGFISMPAFRRVLKAMIKFKEICTEYQVDEIAGVLYYKANDKTIYAYNLQN